MPASSEEDILQAPLVVCERKEKKVTASPERKKERTKKLKRVSEPKQNQSKKKE
jgi:hypothetical protein